MTLCLIGSLPASLNIEAPDAQTPANIYRANNAYRAHLQFYFQTLSQAQAGQPDCGHPIYFPDMDNLQSVNQSLAWESEAVLSSPDRLVI